MAFAFLLLAASTCESVWPHIASVLASPHFLTCVDLRLRLARALCPACLGGISYPGVFTGYLHLPSKHVRS